MDTEKPQHVPGGEGCLVGVLRVPVKIVAVLVVLPVRLIWDLLVLAARTTHRRALRPVGAAAARLCSGLYRYVLTPLGHGIAWLGRGVALVVRWLALGLLYWPWVGLWRYVLVPVAAAAHRYLLGPLGRGLVRAVLALGQHVLAPVGRGLVRLLTAVHRHLLAPVAGGLYRRMLTPLGHGLRWFLPRAFAAVFVWPWVGLWRYVLTPLGRGIAWLARGLALVLKWLLLGLFHWPWVALWRYVLVPGATVTHRYLLAPLGRNIYRYLLTPLGHLLAGAWRLAGRISRALGRGLLWLWRGCVARPCAWVHRHVATPAGHALRAVWRTSRTAVREARDEVRRLLFGTPPGEPARSRARTLGSTKAAGNAPAPEISLRKTQG
ncbi:hypothetical protein ACFWBC_28330 [Streptomyces sp. NPDC059985]|uniref:hypothetical protein n=1 Tax=Streptomyces sp. NPDC059985 TaxID=3347025 RepID=UPI003682B442